MQFGVKVTGSRSKVASTLIFRMTHLCLLIHPHTKYQPKIFIRLGDTERKGISIWRSQGQGQRSHQYWAICSVCRRKLDTLEETYAVRESRPLYHMRNGFDRESSPQSQWWQALMLISNIDLTTAPLWQRWKWAVLYSARENSIGVITDIRHMNNCRINEISIKLKQ
jgi:hypothetical protein